MLMVCRALPSVHALTSIAWCAMQVDRKFIAVTVQQTNSRDRVLALVDQHAADERVRVEALQRRFLRAARAGAGMQAGNAAARQVLHPAQVLHWTPKEEAAWQAHRTTLERWGWRCNIVADRGATCPTAKVTAVPLVEGTALSPEDLREHLQELAVAQCRCMPLCCTQMLQVNSSRTNSVAVHPVRRMHGNACTTCSSAFVVSLVIFSSTSSFKGVYVLV